MLFIRTSTLLLLISSTAVVVASPIGSRPSSDFMAPILPLAESKSVPDSYLVVFKDGFRAQDFSARIQGFQKRDMSPSQITFGGSRSSSSSGSSSVWNDIAKGIKHVYDIGTFQGIAGHFRSEALDEIRRNPKVAYVERDSVGRLTEIKTQEDSPWGLARISRRRGLTKEDKDKSKFSYAHDPRGGQNVTVFVIDTGINLGHKEFESRAEWGTTTVDGWQFDDDHGHGTHCAGTVGSRAYGVAKSVNLVAVKVIGADGHGTVSQFLRGVEYVIRRHKELIAEQGSSHRGSVATVSIGYERSRTMDTVVRMAVEAGIHFTLAAGNDDANYCEIQSPRAEGTFTVGASTVKDERAYFSNYGSCVDIFAPGRTVLSTWMGSDTETYIASGTSMATPHVAGLLAYYLALQPLSTSAFNSGALTPKELKSLVLSRATRDALSNVPSDTVNLLAYNGAEEDKEYFHSW